MHYIASLRSVQSCMNASMDAELAVLNVSAYCWKKVAIRKHMVGHESYQYRYSIWIEALALMAYARPLIHKI